MSRTLSTRGLSNVHPREACEGRGCPVHHPSSHHMREWPATWRDDRGIVERHCEHGIGHPDPDDAAYRATRGDVDTVHGCDGCCAVRGHPDTGQ